MGSLAASEATVCGKSSRLLILPISPSSHPWLSMLARHFSLASSMRKMSQFSACRTMRSRWATVRTSSSRSSASLDEVAELDELAQALVALPTLLSSCAFLIPSATIRPALTTMSLTSA